MENRRENFSDIKLNNDLLQDGQSIAEHFNNKFLSVSKKIAYNRKVSTAVSKIFIIVTRLVLYNWFFIQVIMYICIRFNQ